jgi:hypothetical protein
VPSENLTVARILNILAWVVLVLGGICAATALFLTPAFTLQTVLLLILALAGLLIAFVSLNVLARILKTVTYLYQLSWEQFKELGDDIDLLDGSFDGSDGPQCGYCGALIQKGMEKCPRCGKPLSEAPGGASGPDKPSLEAR